MVHCLETVGIILCVSRHILKVKESPMKAERHNVLSVGPVYRSQVSGVQQEEVALLRHPIKPDGHQNPIILCFSIWVWNKNSLTIVMVFLISSG